MKLSIRILTLSFILLPALTWGFDFGELKDKANEASKEYLENSDGFDLSAAKEKLDSVFSSSNPLVKGTLDKALNAFTENKDLGFLKHAKALADMSLTKKQTAVWTPIKHDIMAAIVSRNFSFENTRSSELVGDAISSIRKGDLAGLKSSFSTLKDVATLNSKQKKLVTQIQDNVAPLMDMAKDFKSPFGG